MEGEYLFQVGFKFSEKYKFKKYNIVFSDLKNIRTNFSPKESYVMYEIVLVTENMIILFFGDKDDNFTKLNFSVL